MSDLKAKHEYCLTKIRKLDSRERRFITALKDVDNIATINDLEKKLLQDIWEKLIDDGYNRKQD